MVEEYLSGVSAAKLSKKYKISIYYVLKYLKKNGVNVINRQNEIKWNVEESIKLYNSGKSLSDIAKLNNICVSVISLKFKRLGVDVVNRHNQIRFNENVFDKIDTEEKAYWLGFIYADGYISKRDNNFELTLGLKDVEHLKKFAKFMSYESNVKTDSYRCRFSVTNKHLKSMLVLLGVTPQKSLTLKFPNSDQVPVEFLNHFIRGYFDGDGSVMICGAKKNKLKTNLIGTKKFLKKVLFICKISKKLSHDKRHNMNVFYFDLAIAKSKKLLKYIYKNSTIFLERKFNIYKNYSTLKSV